MRDIDVRRALRRKVLDHHHEDPDTIVVDELGLCHGTARVDIAVVNGRIHGFELKSERDTLTRLPGQVQVYSAALDRVTLVTHEDHYGDALGLIPDWWGIKVATAGPRKAINFEHVRFPRDNPTLDPIAVAMLLWSDEALDALEAIGAARGARGKPRRELYSKLVAAMALDQLRALVRAALKARTRWRPTLKTERADPPLV